MCSTAPQILPEMVGNLPSTSPTDLFSKIKFVKLPQLHTSATDLVSHVGKSIKLPQIDGVAYGISPINVNDLILLDMSRWDQYGVDIWSVYPYFIDIGDFIDLSSLIDQEFTFNDLYFDVKIDIMIDFMIWEIINEQFHAIEQQIALNAVVNGLIDSMILELGDLAINEHNQQVALDAVAGELFEQNYDSFDRISSDDVASERETNELVNVRPAQKAKNSCPMPQNNNSFTFHPKHSADTVLYK